MILIGCDNMKTLCVCPTYGRIPFLNRMLSSFLHQDYDDKHLVIVNDDDNIQLCCDYSNVTCINLNKKILLPQKRNIANSVGYQDIILPHDDDDIFLPNKISKHVVKHQENPDIFMYRNSASYVIYGDEFKLESSSPTVTSYTRDAWNNVGGYRHTQNSGEDWEFFNKMPNKLVERNEDEVDYVYNWGNINYHMTFEKDENVEKIAYDQLVRMNLLGKKYWIEPDFEQYNNFLLLDQMWKKNKKTLIVKHLEHGKIDVSHLI